MDKYEVLTNIQIYTDKFNETKFFPYAMQVFILANSNGLPIPKEVLDAIEKGFTEWFRHDGKLPLNDIYKLNPGCSGNRSCLTKTYANKRDYNILLIVEKLILLGVDSGEAIEAVCVLARKKYEEDPKKYRWLRPSNSGRKSDDPESKCDPIQFTSIKKNLWEKRESDSSKIYSEVKKAAAQSVIFMSDEEKEKFVDSFRQLMVNKKFTKKHSPKSIEDCFKELTS